MRDIKFEYVVELSDGKIIRTVKTLEQIEISDDFRSFGKVLSAHITGAKILAKRQYTGITDEQGVEIYDGDIVSCLDTNGLLQVIEVKFDIYRCGFYPMCDYLTDFPFSYFNVIGNIFENGDLLK